MNVTTGYLWLDGCDPAALTEAALEAALLAAVRAGGFELLYHHVSTHQGRTVALAVVGESHVVLHAEVPARSVCAEVLSCTTAAAARAVIDAVRDAIPHQSATDQWVDYEVERGFAP